MMTSIEPPAATRRYYRGVVKGVCGATSINDMLAVPEVGNLNDALAARD
jgi:hypothetical protein